VGGREAKERGRTTLDQEGIEIETHTTNSMSHFSSRTSSEATVPVKKGREEHRDFLTLPGLLEKAGGGKKIAKKKGRSEGPRRGGGATKEKLRALNTY